MTDDEEHMTKITWSWLYRKLSLIGDYDTREPYSVMQQDGNSFCGDVVLESFNMA